MTDGSVEAQDWRPPILILGLGNPLLGDDGAGLRVFEDLASAKAGHWSEAVEFLDGGTQGIALTGAFGGRRAVVILDAVRAGRPPGTVHLLRSPRAGRGAVFLVSGGGLFPFRGVRSAQASATAHDGNAQELIATAALLGESPEELFVIGIEPQELNTGIGLSAAVESAIPRALHKAVEVVEHLLIQQAPLGEGVGCPCA